MSNAKKGPNKQKYEPTECKYPDSDYQNAYGPDAAERGHMAGLLFTELDHEPGERMIRTEAQLKDYRKNVARILAVLEAIERREEVKDDEAVRAIMTIQAWGGGLRTIDPNKLH